MEVFAYRVQILDPDLIFRMIGFTTFLMAWLIRLADPGNKYPAQQVPFVIARLAVIIMQS